MGKVKERELKERTAMSAAEIGRLKARGGREMRKVLDPSLEVISSEAMRDGIRRIYESEFDLQMDTNALFFEDVNKFLFERHSEREKTIFFRRVISFLQKNGNIPAVIAARYPETYSLAPSSFSEAASPLAKYIAGGVSGFAGRAGALWSSAVKHILKFVAFIKAFAVKISRKENR